MSCHKQLFSQWWPRNLFKEGLGMALNQTWDGSGNLVSEEAVPDETPVKTDIEILQEQNDTLQALVSQTNVNFSAFMDYYFSINPE